AAALAGCSSEGAAANASASAAVASSETSATAAPATALPGGGFDPAAATACAGRRAEAQKAKPAPGAPEGSKQAIQFARGRSRPVLWLKQPKIPTAIDELGDTKKSSIRLVRAVKDIVSKRGDPDARRAKVLSEGGYLFSDDPLIALALIEQVSL